ncbi:uncharacterized protein MONBRDRAFT_15863 [Monosiga brevicollis MX1]|uniref:CAAX prenyl protease n=1 Tax=Monosiga brevicollis TaxID=81824 RepID=A9UVI0_MONBE|nr:uncharacterized protein MONBRDRAFT_15863 [Monosiga brevicollis MX1]EDQ90583.1 predicted protein [Monosiga brevicollis MX1]|eukprot:XP_001744634.1 hypothetical protein [Monosiga brevicollis MX1]
MESLGVWMETVKEAPLFWGSLGLTTSIWLLDSLYLTGRERAACRRMSVPAPLAGRVSQEDFDSAREYRYESLSFSLLKSSSDFIVSTGLLIAGFMPFSWHLSGQVSEALGLPPATHPICHSIVFMTLTSLFDFVSDLPWRIYETFSLEARHGFNKQTPAFFLKDQIKMLGVNLALVSLLLSAFLKVIEWAGDNFFFYLWLTATASSVVLVLVYHDFIAPLFDTYTELPHGDLRTAIEALASSLKFPLTKLYLVHNSVRNSHSNAYFYGWGSNKRIVLFDTLLDAKLREQVTSETEGAVAEADDQAKAGGCSIPQIVAVLAHELGHWQHGHVYKTFLLQQLYFCGIFYLFQRLYGVDAIFEQFGFANERPTLIAMTIIFGYILSPLNTIWSIVLTAFTRRAEFEADAFAVKLGQGEALCEGLIKLSADNKSYPVHDWLYSAVHHSHPPILQRLAAIRSKKQQ